MSNTLKSQVILYTDGACSGNPGRGGYGVVMIHGPYRKELSAGYRKTTNNRMELTAVIKGLEALKRSCCVQLHTDSSYIVNAINQGWARKWRAQNWMRNKKDRAENSDLWEQVLELCEYHTLEFVWVRGHAGNAENECADLLAVAAAQNEPLLIDFRYEKG